MRPKHTGSHTARAALRSALLIGVALTALLGVARGTPPEPAADGGPATARPHDCRHLLRGHVPCGGLGRRLRQYEFFPFGFPILLNPALGVIDGVGRTTYVRPPSEEEGRRDAAAYGCRGELVGEGAPRQIAQCANLPGDRGRPGGGAEPPPPPLSAGSHGASLGSGGAVGWGGVGRWRRR